MEVEDKKRNKRIGIIFGVILSIFCFGTWWCFNKSRSYYFLFLASFVSLITLSVLLNPFREKVVVKTILKIIGGVLGTLYLATIVLSSFLLIYLSVLIVWAMLTIVFKGIIWVLIYFDIVINKKLFQLPILYCSILFTLVIISYFGDSIVVLLDKFLSVGATRKNELSRNIAKRVLQVFNVRRRTYELSIILYVLSVVENISTMSLFSIDIWESYKQIALEVLITYVAIDGYVSTFLDSSKK